MTTLTDGCVDEHLPSLPTCEMRPATAATEPDDYFLRDVIFDRVGEVYTDDVIRIVRDWLRTYERAGCTLGDVQAELELE